MDAGCEWILSLAPGGRFASRTRTSLLSSFNLTVLGFATRTSCANAGRESRSSATTASLFISPFYNPRPYEDSSACPAGRAASPRSHILDRCARFGDGADRRRGAIALVRGRPDRAVGGGGRRGGRDAELCRSVVRQAGTRS